MHLSVCHGYGVIENYKHTSDLLFFWNIICIHFCVAAGYYLLTGQGARFDIGWWVVYFCVNYISCIYVQCPPTHTNKEKKTY